MDIDIQFAPSPPHPNLLSERVAVVIDVLRATSVIVHAMVQGALEIIPVATVEEAFQEAKGFPQDSIVLGGERESKKCARLRSAWPVQRQRSPESPLHRRIVPIFSRRMGNEYRHAR